MSSHAIPGRIMLALLLLVALSALSLAASDDLTFQAIMSQRQAKLFQYPGGAYSVEVVEIMGEKARFFINGETLSNVGSRDALALRDLADRRHLHGERLARPPLAGLIYEWHRLGYLHLERRE